MASNASVSHKWGVFDADAQVAVPGCLAGIASDQALTRHAVRRRSCQHSLRQALKLEVHLFGEPFEGPGGGVDSTRSLMFALERAGFDCEDAQPHQHDALQLLLGGWQGTPTLAPRPWAPKGSQTSVCSYYAGIRDLMRSLIERGSSPIVAFCWGGEFATFADALSFQSWLRGWGIDPTRAFFLHLNVGIMLPFRSADDLTDTDRAAFHQHWAPVEQSVPRHRAKERLSLNQAWWGHYFWEFGSRVRHDEAISRHVERYNACRDRGALLARIVSGRRAAANSGGVPPLLVLGGQPHDWRGLVYLELMRRGLLSERASRWSAASFGFCNSSSCGNALAPPGACRSQLAVAEFWKDSPLGKLASNDAALVRRLCSQLPHVLDVDPSRKALVDYSTDHQVWRGTRVALTLETLYHLNDRSAEYAFYTEKALKPLLQLAVPLVVGSPGTLAMLSSLGFRSSGVLNETYDSIASGIDRLQAVLAEAERVAGLPASVWEEPSLLDALVHNHLHFLCGGFRDALSERALEIVLLAEARAKKLAGATNNVSPS